MFEHVEQKQLERSEKSLFFLQYRQCIVFGSDKCQVCSKITFSCTFAVIQIFDNIRSPFISWAISMKLSGYNFVHAHLH
jgi:hypothetical protein